MAIATIEFRGLNEALKKFETSIEKDLMRSMGEAARAMSEVAGLGMSTMPMSATEQSIKLAYEKYPQFLGVKLERLRNGMAEDEGKPRMGGIADWHRVYVSPSRVDLEEILHLSAFRKEEYGNHGSYVAAVEGMVRRWNVDYHYALAAHMEATVTGTMDPEAIARRVKMIEEQQQLAQAQRLAQRVRESEEAGKLARIAEESKALADKLKAEAKRRADDEAELEAAVLLEQRMVNPNFATW